jgi:transcriptional regulator with XRE-family HTH domain
MSLISAHCERHGITRAEFARRVRTNARNVSEWIIHRRLPRKEVLKRVAAELNISVEKLVNDIYR